MFKRVIIYKLTLDLTRLYYPQKGNVMTAKDVFDLIISNQVFIGGLSGWFMAEVIKTIIDAIINRKFDITRLWGDGGMPSAHSATVTSVATSTALVCGLNSPEFALSLAFAFVTMRDAMGVRLETGRQAVVINKMVDLFAPNNPTLSADQQLKEFVGHTPTQVVIGGILGIAVGILVNFLYH